MRDPTRIRPFLAVLSTLWKQHPDLRFGQLIQGLTEGNDREAFNWEEEAWLKHVVRRLKESDAWCHSKKKRKRKESSK